MGSKAVSVEEFIQRSEKNHKWKYDYSLVQFNNTKQYVKIICKEHGVFEQMANEHLRGCECKRCHQTSRTSSIGEFIRKALDVHGGKYDYSHTEYKNAATKVAIRCIKHDSVFWQTPNSHLGGSGCKLCGNEGTSAYRSGSLEKFLLDAETVHGCVYDYRDVEYISAKTNVIIHCNLHGRFEQTPDKHTSGQGCPTCGALYLASLQRDDLEDFTIKANNVHSNKYRYIALDRSSGKSVVVAHCLLHGKFEQLAASHIQGCGCPKCAKAGFSSDKRGYFYVLRCGDITKVGITNVSPLTRAKRVSKSFGADFDVVKSTLFEDGGLADRLETAVLRELRNSHNQPVARFEGSTECFLNVDITTLDKIISEETLKLTG